MAIEIIEIAVKIILVVILCGLIGIERLLHHKDAGLRTHILIGVGSALLVLTSLYVFDLYGKTVDPTRIIAGIVTGIGFLCAGTIIRGGTGIIGLTTAASMWVASGIGMAVAVGHYVLATAVTLIVLVVLSGLKKFEEKLNKFSK